MWEFKVNKTKRLNGELKIYFIFITTIQIATLKTDYIAPYYQGINEF